MEFKELPDIVVQTIDEVGKHGQDVEKTCQYAVAGHIVLDLLVSQSIFLQITQENNIFKQVKHYVLLLERNLLKKTISSIYADQTIWGANNYSLSEKIQISYQILGYEYLRGSYDKMYGIFVKVLMMTFEGLRSIIGDVQPKQFEIGNDDFSGKDNELLNLSERLNITYSLLFFSLRTRSQLGIQVWQHAGVPLPSFLSPDKLSKQKRLMFNIGKTAVLLAAYEFCYNAGILNSIDITSLCTENVVINRDDFFGHLHKVFQTKELATILFDALALQNLGRISGNDKCQVFENVAFSFFISNFNPGKAFCDIFGQNIADYYKNGFENAIDHKYAVYSLMEKLGLSVDYKGEQDNNTFRASVIIDRKFKFSSSGQFKDETKAKLWKHVYNNTVDSIKRFLCGQKPVCSIELLQLFISKMSTLSIGMLRSVGKNTWLMNVHSIAQIGVEEYRSIVMESKKVINNSEVWNKLIDMLILLNENRYVCFDSKIYKYSEALALFEGRKNYEKLHPININRANCISIYQRIVNPTEALQMKIIELDYRVVKHINPLSFTVAKYAIDHCLDAFNQMVLPSQKIKEYYQEILANIEEEKADTGTLTCDVSQAKIVLFDSNRLLTDQLYELVAPMKLKKAVFACGYCFKSGLSLLDRIISKTVYDNIPVQFVVGSLQKYRACADGSGTVTGIDKTTAELLNQYLDGDNVQLYTCESRFYHGKIYQFEADKETVVCIGSSNISRSAYALNYELNIGFVLQNDSELKHNFDLFIQRVIKRSTLIDYLDESVFGDNEINMEGSAIISKVPLSSVQKRINELTNEEVKYRLNLWMSYSPAIAAEELCIKALPNYFVFVYPDKKLMVLESFTAGNAYFCLKYSDSFESEINRISTLSKTEIFQYSQMSKRGYHLANKFTLESNIRRYFR